MTTSTTTSMTTSTTTSTTTSISSSKTTSTITSKTSTPTSTTTTSSSSTPPISTTLVASTTTTPLIIQGTILHFTRHKDLSPSLAKTFFSHFLMLKVSGLKTHFLRENLF